MWLALMDLFVATAVQKNDIACHVPLVLGKHSQPLVDVVSFRSLKVKATLGASPVLIFEELLPDFGLIDQVAIDCGQLKTPRQVPVSFAVTARPLSKELIDLG